MPRKFFAIGTATTPRKKDAINKARSGRLDIKSYEYAKAKWQASLFGSLRRSIPARITDQQVWEFAEECVDDAFTRIKEYDERYKFREFLVNKIVLPAYEKLLRKHNQEKEVIETQKQDITYKLQKLNPDVIIEETKEKLEVELAKDVLRQLKEQDEVKYEVFCYRELNGWEYKAIADELKITEANARQIHGRVKKDIIPELFDQISSSNKYIDKDLSIRDDIIALLKKGIKKE